MPARANGLTLCSGSLGANPANDVPAIAARFADRIHFAHLRNVRKDPDGSFEEAAHLDGDTDMVALCAVLAGEEKRRREEGRADHAIPYRPDHGHELLSDIGAGTHPGYPLIGRLRGLAGTARRVPGGGARLRAVRNDFPVSESARGRVSRIVRALPEPFGRTMLRLRARGAERSSKLGT